MAAYVDAVRYRAAWLADADAFRLEGDFRGLARASSGSAEAARSATPRGRSRRAFAVLVSAALLAAIVAGLRPLGSASSMGFKLSPAVLEASAQSSARGLVLPGAEAYADRVRPELRSGPSAGSLALDRELKAAIEVYERGSRDPAAGARVVAALLANGEIEAAGDYAREGLRLHPDAVPLLVFGADARYRANDLAGAEALLRRAADRAPRDPLVALDLGLVLRQLGRSDEARRALQRASGTHVAPLSARARRELAPAR
jgi:tetratricopeptide (TPR) repeat protein